MSHTWIPQAAAAAATAAVAQVEKKYRTLSLHRFFDSIGKKSCVSFAEYSLFYRALLQKRPVILRSLVIVTTPHS